MTTKPKLLRAVTERVVDELTGSAMLFTALDVSNAVKKTLPDARHREISPVVRALFDDGAMGPYQHTLIDVMAGGSEPAKAFLYHLPEQPVEAYDDAMRAQVSIPPVAASAASDDPAIVASTTEAKVRVGKDGRGRVPRRLLENAGITGDSVAVTADGARLILRSPLAAGAGDRTITAVHPALLHLPAALLAPLGADRLIARIDGATVVVSKR